METKLFLYHVNDLHSHFDQWPKIVSYLKKRKEHHRLRDEQALFFDIGDHVDRSHPITEASMGKNNVELMNDIGYDYATFGNNEGITLSKEDLDALYGNANFQVLVGNLFDRHGNRPKWAKPYDVMTLENGLKIGVIAMTVPFQKFYELLGWEVRDPFELLPGIVEHVKAQADIIVLMSHLGLHDDERIAEEIDGIDVIIGGHTHHLLKEGMHRNGKLLGMAGKWGHYVGQMMVTVDMETKKIVKKEAYAVPMDTEEDSPEAVSHIKRLQEESNAEMGEIISHLEKELDLKWFEESPFTALLAKGLRAWCDAEIAMVNAGILLEPLPQGPIKKRDIHRICPHPINPCKIELKGDQLREVIAQAFTEKMQQLKIKGLGFRGKVMGRMIFDGVEVETAVLKDGQEHVKEIHIHGEPLDPDRNYSIATIDMFTFGPLYPEISHAPEKRYYMPEMVRDVLAWELGRRFPNSDGVDKTHFEGEAFYKQ